MSIIRLNVGKEWVEWNIEVWTRSKRDHWGRTRVSTVRNVVSFHELWLELGLYWVFREEIFFLSLASSFLFLGCCCFCYLSYSILYSHKFVEKPINIWKLNCLFFNIALRANRKFQSLYKCNKYFLWYLWKSHLSFINVLWYSLTEQNNSLPYGFKMISSAWTSTFDSFENIGLLENNSLKKMSHI